MLQTFYKKRGFTLAEMLVSMGIVTAILATILFNQKSYTEAASLSNLADAISLTLAEAQAYGIGVKELTPGSNIFSSGYGLSLSLLESNSKYSYIFYSDRNGNIFYDGSWNCAAEECIEKVPITNNNFVDSFCILRSQGSNHCSNLSRVDVAFYRPDVEAKFRFFNSGGQSFELPNTVGVRITLKSPSGLTKSVIVYNTGQISVE